MIVVKNMFFLKNAPHKEPLIKPENDAVIRCANENNCESQLIEKIKHFISRDAMNIEGLVKNKLKVFSKKEFLTRFQIFIVYINLETIL